MHLVYANLMSDGNPMNAMYQYINPWCVGKGGHQWLLCVQVIVLFMSVLFTISWNGSARYLANVVYPFCIYPVVSFHFIYLHPCCHIL